MKFKKLAVMGAVVASFIATNVNAADITLTKRNTIVMDKEFVPEVTARVSVKAAIMDATLPAGEPIYLVLNTPGGSIFAGLEMIDNLNSLSRPIHTITIFAASMGFQTVQQLKGTRYIVENGTLMSHKAKGGIEGEFPGQLDERYKYILGVVTEMDVKAAKRSKGKHDLSSYQKLVENEFWCGPAECAKNGFIDTKVSVTCDASLAGFHEELAEEANLFGLQLQVFATFSDCPTITAPVSLRVSADGQDLSKVIHKLTRDQKEAIHALKTKTAKTLSNKTKKVSFLK